MCAASALPAYGQASEAAYLAGNALIGGFTAALFQSSRGGAFWPAFRVGALGGSIAYAGRKVTAEEFSGAGLLGRELGAVGASLVSNAAHGRPPLERFVLPFGPTRVYITTKPVDVTFKLDLPTATATMYYALSGARFDAAASLSAGAPVFEQHVTFADGHWRGDQIAGVIKATGNPSDPNPDAPKSLVLAHERVHTLQYDFALVAWSEPAEAWLARHLPGGSWLQRHIDFGLHLLPWQLLNTVVPYRARPWEAEARFLSGVRADP